MIKLNVLAKELGVMMKTLKRKAALEGIEIHRAGEKTPYMISEKDAQTIRDFYIYDPNAIPTRDKPLVFQCKGCPAVNHARGRCYATTDPSHWWDKTKGQSCELQDSIIRQEQKGIRYADILEMTQSMPGYM